MLKRLFKLTFIAACPIFSAGCSAIGSKAASLSMVYAAMALIALLILVGYCSMPRAKDRWFILLFASVTIVNAGYFGLSVSQTLNMALIANRVSYLGSVFLPMSMLMIILNVTGVSYKRWLPAVLLVIGLFTFMVAASPGYLDIYYKEVFLETVGGITVLNKVYGPWHCIYLYYLTAYFVAMISVTVYAVVKKKIESTTNSVILIVAVSVNLGVWLIEQMANINFEILSVSYIISELFLLGLQFVMQENQKLKELVASQNEGSVIHEETETFEGSEAPEPVEDRAKTFVENLSSLTKTEHRIYDLLVSGKTTKEIMAEMNIKENTLKFHNKNIYSKLGVSSRKQLKELYIQAKAEMFDI